MPDRHEKEQQGLSGSLSNHLSPATYSPHRPVPQSDSAVVPLDRGAGRADHILTDAVTCKQVSVSEMLVNIASIVVRIRTDPPCSSPATLLTLCMLPNEPTV